MNLFFSVIVPVYNRPNEIEELLESFTQQDYNEKYEIVIVEDGSSESSETIVDNYRSRLPLTYFYKENSGPGDSRNYGMQKAAGNYFIVLDSDVILPPTYLSTIHKFLKEQYVDCFGGSDAAHESFSNLQKAINYVMTSFLTTGGIRGSKLKIQKFEPRSFNMGISKEAFEATQGFARIHPGEDPDLSRRIEKAGFRTNFLPGAAVFHKRRISWKKFHTQVKKFGMVRPILSSWHPETAKLTFWLPSLFVGFVLVSVTAAIATQNPIYLSVLLGYLGFIAIHATVLNKSIVVGVLSVFAVLVQFFGYGLAFVKSSFFIRLLKKNPEKQFPQLFFKEKL